VRNSFHLALPKSCGEARGKVFVSSTLRQIHSSDTLVRMRVIWFLENLSCLATWHAVRGLSPVIIAT